MEMQNDLFGPPPMQMPRGIGIDEQGVYGLFFALRPPEDTWPEFSRQTELLFRRFDLRGTRQNADRLHLTAAVTGRHDRKRAPYLDAVVRSLQAFRAPPIDVVFETAMLFGASGDRSSLVLVADAQAQRAISNLRDRLLAAQLHDGLTASRAKFDAHITIGHVHPASGFPTDVPPIRFAARQLDLIATYPGRHLHRIVHSWPLDG